MFQPVKDNYKVQVEDSGTFIGLACRDGKVVDLSITGFGMYKTFIKNIPMWVFKSNLNALKNDLESKNTDEQYRLLEWLDGEGLTINMKNTMIRLTTSESRLQSFIDYADEFLEEVQENLNEEATWKRLTR